VRNSPPIFSFNYVEYRFGELPISHWNWTSFMILGGTHIKKKCSSKDAWWRQNCVRFNLGFTGKIGIRGGLASKGAVVAAAVDVTLWVLRWAKIEFALDIWDISFEFLLSLFLISFHFSSTFSCNSFKILTRDCGV
jgi:hypothetical protein